MLLRRGLVFRRLRDYDRIVLDPGRIRHHAVGRPRVADEREARLNFVIFHPFIHASIHILTLVIVLERRGILNSEVNSLQNVEA